MFSKDDANDLRRRQQNLCFGGWQGFIYWGVQGGSFPPKIINMPVQSTYKSGCGQGFQGVLPPPKQKILDETLVGATFSSEDGPQESVARFCRWCGRI